MLIPRPDSETLIEAAVAHFGERGPATILDLGTGPGTLLLAALDQWPEARGLGVDASEEALAYARAQCRAARPCRPRRLPPRRLGRRARRALRPDPLQPALCRGRRRAAARRRATRSRPRRCSPAPTASTPIARSRRSSRRLLAPGGIACLEIGAGQASRRSGALRRRRASRYRHASDLSGIVRCLIAARLIRISAFSLGFAARHGYIGGRDGADHSIECVRA